MVDTMHIVLSSDDNYAKYLAVTIASVICNRKDSDVLFFHILDGSITQENRDKIKSMTAERGASIEFLPIDQALFSGKVLNITEKNHVTLATYYRLLIPSLIQVDRCIYMDCDMICRASLAPVWKTKLDDCIAQLKLSTRHYAKRQLTWFKKKEGYIPICVDKEDAFDAACKILGDAL